MGSFGGHALPGSFYIVFALWHLIQHCRLFFKSRLKNGAAFKSRTYFVTSCGSKYPLECYAKLFAVSVGIAAEVVTGFKDGHFQHLGNAQHITMFGFFAMCFMLEVLHHFKFSLPPNIIHVSFMMAFAIEAILFYWHLHNRESMDVQVHMLLIYVLGATVVCLLAEIRYRHSVAPPLLRCYLVLLQGVWFLQVGFILYPPFHLAKWDLNNHEQMMIVTVLFCFWAAVCFVLVCFVWFATACCFGMCRQPRGFVDGNPPSSDQIVTNGFTTRNGALKTQCFELADAKAGDRESLLHKTDFLSDSDEDENNIFVAA